MNVESPGLSPGRADARLDLSPHAGRGDAAPANLVLLGEFGRAHGLAGEVRLKSYTADPPAIARYGPLLASDGRRVVLTHARQAAGDQPDLLVVRVEGVASREAAERLSRLALRIERERLGPAEEDEFYLADLVGLAVEGPDGPLGRIVGVPDYGGGELLEVALAEGRRTVLLPFTKAFVPEIDLAAGRVVIAPPANWLDETPDGPT